MKLWPFMDGNQKMAGGQAAHQFAGLAEFECAAKARFRRDWTAASLYGSGSG